MMIETPRDTSADRPITQLAGMMALGSEGFITGQEAQGQRELVGSETIPIDGSEALTDLGFVLGEPVDDLFRKCTLPEGWYREATGHSMHSIIRDERGYGRVGMFYKAAFYDRRADCRVVRLPRTKPQEDAYETLSVEVDADGLWMYGRDRREGEDYVYQWRGRYGDAAPEGKHAYSDDGRRIEVRVSPNGGIVAKDAFTAEPEDLL
ncbi:MAG TPA: hypothetical protein VMT20_07240 [Terriglobia bacterium]|nr:hypothetical protein [Terriglobia bacterium]